MASTSSRSTSKLFGDSVIASAQKLEYMSIARKEGSFTTGHRQLSGHKIAWGDGAKANKNLIYVPSARVAGTEDDVRAFLKARGLTDQHIEPFIKGAYTAANYNSSEKHRMYKWVKTSDPQHPFNFEEVGTTYKQDFDREIAMLEEKKAERKAEGKAGPKSLDFDALSSMAAQISSGEKGAPAAGSTAKKTRSGGKQDLESRLKKAKEENAFFNVTNTNNLGRNARQVDKLPSNAVRLSATPSDPYYVAFFTYKPGTDELPQGPAHFVHLMNKKHGWDYNKAAEYVRGRVASTAPSAGLGSLPAGQEVKATSRHVPLPPASSQGASELPAAPSALPRALPAASGLPAAPSSLPMPSGLPAPARAASPVRARGGLPMPLPMPGR